MNPEGNFGEETGNRRGKEIGWGHPLQGSIGKTQLSPEQGNGQQFGPVLRLSVNLDHAEKDLAIPLTNGLKFLHLVEADIICLEGGFPLFEFL